MIINIKIPRSWNELSEKQLQEISQIMEIYRRSANAKDLQLQIRLYYQVVKNLLRENNSLKVWIALRHIPPEEYKNHAKFLYENNSRTQFPRAFKRKGKTYHPPLARLQNVTIKEFSFLDAMYYHWRTTGKDTYLDLLSAALYRPEGGNELDIRKPFDKILVEKELPAFRKLLHKKKLAIAYTYEGCRNYIVNLYPGVFPQLPTSNKTKRGTYTPFGKLLIHKIGFDTSKFQQTQNLNAHEFLGIYENELTELKKQKLHGANA